MKQILASVKVYIKLLVRNKFFIILHIGVFALIIMQSPVIHDLFAAEWYMYMAYAYIYGYFCITTIIMMISKNHYEYIRVYSNNESRNILSVFITGIILSISVLIQPTIFLIYYLVTSPASFAGGILNVICHLYFEWGIGFLVAVVLGIFLGRRFKGIFSYIGIIIACYFTLPYGFFHETEFGNLFLVGVQNLDVGYSSFLGYMHNMDFIFHNLFLVSFCIFILCICIYLENNKANIKGRAEKVIAVISILCIVGSFYGNFRFYPVKIRDITLRDIKSNESNIKITDYNMDIYLGNKFKNICTLSVENIGLKEIKKVELNLDKHFKIKEISEGNRTLKFIKNNDNIVIDINKNLKKGQRVKLNFKYEGNVNIEDSIGYKMYYSSKEGTYLPQYNFLWYPRDSKDENKNFSIKVHANKQVYTNVKKNNRKEKSVQCFSGKAKSFFLLNGFSDEINLEDKRIICGAELCRKKISILKNSQKFLEYVNDIYPELNIKSKWPNIKNIYVIPMTLSENTIYYVNDSIFISDDSFSF